MVILCERCKLVSVHVQCAFAMFASSILLLDCRNNAMNWQMQLVYMAKAMCSEILIHSFFAVQSVQRGDLR